MSSEQLRVNAQPSVGRKLVLGTAAFSAIAIFVMTGLCGGYTTFSAFSLQSLSLFQQGDWLRGSGYITASVVLCVMAVWAGYGLAMAINGASD